MSQRVRVQNFGVTLDGYGAGNNQSLEQPFGDLNPMQLLGWALSAASHPYHGGDSGTRGIDDYLVRDYARNIGAEIMGSGKFSPYRGPWKDESWKGWWGDTPPFHTPVFVLTHHLRPSFSVSDTTFHFVDSTPEEALRMAKVAANGKDVRIGGGATTIREFLDADLIDEMQISVAPFNAGGGARLWESYDFLLDRFELETVPSPSGVTHLFFWRKEQRKEAK